MEEKILAILLDMQQNIYEIAQLTVSQNSAILNFSSFYKEAPEHGTTENQ